MCFTVIIPKLQEVFFSLRRVYCLTKKIILNKRLTTLLPFGISHLKLQCRGRCSSSTAHELPPWDSTSTPPLCHEPPQWWFYDTWLFERFIPRLERVSFRCPHILSKKLRPDYTRVCHAFYYCLKKTLTGGWPPPLLDPCILISLHTHQ